MADSSKTEKATPKRREKARSQGQVPRSKELSSVLAMTGVVAALWGMSLGAISHWTTFYRTVLDEAAVGTIDINGPLLFWSSMEVFRWLVPVFATAVVLVIAAGQAQGGISFAPEALNLKFDRFNPASKLASMFSPAGLSTLFKSLLPFAAIALVSVNTLRDHWSVIVHASYDNLRVMAAMIGAMVFQLAWKAGLILLAWSAVDYLLMWRKSESDLKMSHSDIKEESVQSEGNPVIKRRIRRLQRQMRRKQSLAATKTATVVVTNPTHYAVGLRYTAEMVAPVVVSKGLDLLAQEIKALAIEHGIMLMENKPLAQALYKSVEVGDAIPSQLYHAVAELLVIVFKAQAEVRQQEARRRSRNASGQVINR